MKKKKNKTERNEKISNELFIKIPFFQVRFPIKNNWIYYLVLSIIIAMLLNFIILSWIILLIGFSP